MGNLKIRPRHSLAARVTPVALIVLLVGAIACQPAAAPSPTATRPGAAPAATSTPAAALAPTAAPTAAAQKPGIREARIGITWSVELNSSYPYNQRTGPALGAVQAMVEALFIHDTVKTLTWVPGLATEWATVGGDPYTWQYKLRRGVKFHSGDAFTSKDVAWTFNEEIRRQEVFGGASGNVKKMVSKVEAVDPYTVIIRMIPETTVQPVKAVFGQFAFIMSKDYFDRVGREQFDKTMNGTGPFKWKEWKLGESLTLVANEDYWDPAGVPNFRTLWLPTVPDDDARMAMFLTGQVDVSHLVPVPRIKDVERASLTIRSFPVNDLCFMFFQGTFPDGKFSPPHFEKAPFLNEKNRIAANLAVDRKTITERVMLGAARPSSDIPMGVPGFKESQLWPYDPAKARQLLKESGYLDNPLELHVYGPSIDRWPSARDAQQAVVQMLQEVGFKAKLIEMEYGAYIPIQQTTRQYDLAYTCGYAHGWSMDPILYYTTAYAGGSIHYQHVPTPPEVLAVITAGGKEADPAKRLPLNTAFGDAVREHPIIMPLWELKWTWGINEKRIDWPFAPGHTYPLYNSVRLK